MEALRDVLRGSLGRSLRGMQAIDRLGAAWTIACGPALAGRTNVAGYDAGTLRVEVEDATWLVQVRSMRRTLMRQVSESADVPVDEIQFDLVQRSAAR